jgi:broad specificity phosphatase PhoE
MPKLILVKHALPEVNPQVSSHRWVLSEEGRRRCGWLADELKTQKVSRLFSSLEPKALETAALVAVRTGFMMEPRPDLHENDRTGFGFVEQDELWQRFRMFFNQPTRLTIGEETADGAFERFAAAVRVILDKARGENIAVVTHGTVLTLFVARHNTHVPPFDLWASLGLPSYVIVETKTFVSDGEIHSFPG